MMRGGSNNTIYHKSYPAELDSLAQIKSDILGSARQAGWGDESLGRLELLLEEGAMNVICHAYPEVPGQLEITLALCSGGLLLRLEDTGTPFDPTAAPAPDLEAPTEEREIGGLGIHLLKSLAEKMEYRREGGRNILDIMLLEHK